MTGIVAGRDFPVVWVCSVQEHDAARADERAPEGSPWPVEDVRELVAHGD
jgi:hypothetical protein